MKVIGKLFKSIFAVTATLSFVCLSSIDGAADNWIQGCLVLIAIFAVSIAGVILSDKVSHLVVRLPDTIVALLYGICKVVMILADPYPNKKGSRRYIKYCKSHNKRIRNRYTMQKYIEE